MGNYWKLVNTVINESDVILLVLDARFPELTRNKEIEYKINKKEKIILYVINKCDLISKKAVEKLKKEITPSVFVSAKKKFGGSILFRKILQLSKGEKSTVGVLGFPNVGKSSVVNLLKGRKSASVSSTSGHTRGIQFINAKGRFNLIDTPGVLEFNDPDKYKQIIIGSVNSHKLKDPEFYVMKLIEEFTELFVKKYNEKYINDPYDYLELLAKKNNMLKKGGEPDIDRMARLIIQSWQTGKFH
jgi:ribosome biogenesis GTPase A